MSEKVAIGFKRLTDTARIPSKAHETDSGYDICSDEIAVLCPNTYYKVGTGIAAEIPPGYELQVRPRSGMSSRLGVVAAFGTVDQGYRGEIGVVLFNHGDRDVVVEVGDRVAQLVLCPVVESFAMEVEELSSTDRGTDGFGSTGK